MLKPSYRGEQVKPSLVALLHRGAAYFFGKRKGYLIFSTQKSENDKWKNGKRYPNGCIGLHADACLCLFDESRGKSLKRQVGRFSLTEPLHTISTPKVST
ncbi:hypothetical protein ACIXHW_03935 [Bacteroides fragilis]